MPTPEAMLIDLDDTILDDSGSVADCWREVCSDAVDRIDGIGLQTLLEAIEAQRDWFWSEPARHRQGRMNLRASSRQIVQQALVGLGINLPELAKEIAERYRDLREERFCVFPGAIETLDRLRAEGVRLGLITNGSAAGQRAKIERFKLAQQFDYVLVEGEFGVGKPDPRVYETALEALAVDAAKTWSVGDNLEWDVGAPQQLGVYGIWVDIERKGLPAGAVVRPDRIIKSIAELV